MGVWISIRLSSTNFDFWEKKKKNLTLQMVSTQVEKEIFGSQLLKG